MFASRLRRTGAAAAVLALLTTAAVAVSAPAAAGGCTTGTSLGRVAGRATDQPAGGCVFRGIRYASPPTGALRFRPPRPVGPWHGTLRATDGSAVCPQQRDTKTEDYPDNRSVYTDEDCLKLNVWTPGVHRAHRPVIVFLHGGAARFGTGNEPRYDGARLAGRGDAVVVTVNYRLGVLGWAELGGLDPSYRGSGNNGLRDEMTALRFVRAHIADFGGDPDNVTAVGESEGAFSLAAMLATDHPQQLFHRAVLESGNGYMVHSTALEQRLAAGFVAGSGLHHVSDLNAMNTTQILDLQEKVLGALPGALGGALFFGPYVDGSLIPAPVIDRVTAGNARGIDLIAGSNRDEIRYFAQIDPGVLHLTQHDYDTFFPAPLADRRAAMVARYRSDRTGATEGDIVLAMLTDQAMRVPGTRLVEAQNRWARGYSYRFDWQPHNAASLGAIHTAELPFVFGTLRFTGVPGGDQALHTDRTRITALSNRMMDAWTGFARTGTPDRTWPTYRPTDRTTRIWDTPPETRRAPDDTERALWDGYDFAAITTNAPH